MEVAEAARVAGIHVRSWHVLYLSAVPLYVSAVPLYVDR